MLQPWLAECWTLKDAASTDNVQCPFASPHLSLMGAFLVAGPGPGPGPCAFPAPGLPPLDGATGGRGLAVSKAVSALRGESCGCCWKRCTWPRRLSS